MEWEVEAKQMFKNNLYNIVKMISAEKILQSVRFASSPWNLLIHIMNLLNNKI